MPSCFNWMPSSNYLFFYCNFPLVTVDGEISLTPSLAGPFKTLNLDISPEKNVINLLGALDRGQIAYRFDKNNLLMTLQSISFESDFDKNIKTRYELEGDKVIITLESSTVYQDKNFPTKLYQRIIITIHVNTPGSYTLKVPLKDSTPANQLKPNTYIDYNTTFGITGIAILFIYGLYTLIKNKPQFDILRMCFQ